MPICYDTNFLHLPTSFQIFASSRNTFKNLPWGTSQGNSLNRVVGITMPFKDKAGEVNLTIAAKNEDGYRRMCQLYRQSKEGILSVEELVNEKAGDIYVISCFHGGPVSRTYQETNEIESAIRLITATRSERDICLKKMDEADKEIRDLEREKEELEKTAKKIYTKKEEAVLAIKDEEKKKEAKIKLNKEKEETAIAQAQLKKLKGKITRRKKKRQELLEKAVQLNEELKKKEELEERLSIVNQNGNSNALVYEEVKPLLDVFGDDFLLEIRNDGNSLVTKALLDFSHTYHIGCLHSESSDENETIIILPDNETDTVKISFFSSLFHFPSQAEPLFPILSVLPLIEEDIKKKKKEMETSGRWRQKYVERLEEEKEKLRGEKEGFLRYYAAFKDIYKEDREKMIEIENGSLILCLLGFSDIDPIGNDIPFSGFGKELVITEEGYKKLLKETGIHQEYSLFCNEMEEKGNVHYFSIFPPGFDLIPYCRKENGYYVDFIPDQVSDSFGCSFKVIVSVSASIYQNCVSLLYQSLGITIKEPETDWKTVCDAINTENLTAVPLKGPIFLKEKIETKEQAVEFLNKVTTESPYIIARCLCLEKHYPLYYYTSCLRYFGPRKQSALIGKCRKKKIPILLPDINRSPLHFSVKDSEIIYGIGDIIGVGDEAEKIIENRNSGYHSFVDFLIRCDHISGQTIQKLIYAGCFDRFSPVRMEFITIYSRLAKRIERMRKLQERTERNRKKLEEGAFKTKKEAEKETLRMEREEEEIESIKRYLETYKLPLGRIESEYDHAMMERKVLPFTVSRYVLDDYEELAETMLPIGEVDEHDSVKIFGVISDVSFGKTSKKQMEIATFTLTDQTGSVEVLCFENLLKENITLLKEEEPLIVYGKTDKDAYGGKIKVIANFIGKPSSKLPQTVVLTSDGNADDILFSYAENVNHSYGSQVLVYNHETGLISIQDAYFKQDFESDDLKRICRLKRRLSSG